MEMLPKGTCQSGTSQGNQIGTTLAGNNFVHYEGVLLVRKELLETL